MSNLLELIDIYKRNQFQKEHRPIEIVAIEQKFLKRDIASHCASVLSPEERELYAKYLDSKNQPLGAASFRNYKKQLPEKKRRKSKNA